MIHPLEESMACAIQKNLSILTQTIRTFEEKYQRPPHSVSLLAMGKGQPPEKLLAAQAAGQQLFGENYLQEALKKMARLQPPVEWHFTGRLQANKTRAIAEHFSWVHTLTHEKQAQRLNDQRPLRLPPLNVCIAVNISGETTKSGLRTEAEIKSLLHYCQSLPRLQLRGLMTIPQPTSTFNEQRAALHPLTVLKAHLIQQGFPLDTLSMGMTGDLEAAIAEGATIIRIGRGLFGPRDGVWEYTGRTSKCEVRRK